MMLNQNKKAIFALLALSLALGSFFYVSYVRADDSSVTTLSDEAKKALNDKQDELDKINAKIKAYKEIIDLKQRQGSSLEDQINALEAQANKVQLEIDLNKKQIEDLNGQIGTLTTRIAEQEMIVNRQKDMLSELMRLYYADYANSSVVPLIFSSDDANLFFQDENSTADVSDKVRSLLESMKALRESLTVEHKDLSTKKSQADTLQLQLTERTSYLESTKSTKASLLTKTQADVDKYGNLVDDLKQQREDLENEINDLEAGKVGELNLKDMPPFKHGYLEYPVNTVKITQGYGKTSFSGHYSSGKHNGVDFGGSTGTPILAPRGGKVIGTGALGKYAYGNWAAIDHGDGLVTLYGHMSKVEVHKGDKVDTGEEIGKMGATGFATGPHLHFGTYSANSFEVVPSTSVKGLMIPIGATVNPMNYLP